MKNQDINNETENGKDLKPASPDMEPASTDFKYASPDMEPASTDFKYASPDMKSKTYRKRMPVWMLVITDVLLAVICLGVFSLYEIVLPHKLKSEELVVASAEDLQGNNFELPDTSKEASETMNTSEGSTDTGTYDKNTGADDRNIGADNRNNGTDNRNTGADDRNNETDNRNTGVEDKNTEADDKNTGADDTANSQDNKANKQREDISGDITSTEKASRQARTGNFTNYGNTNTDNISANDSDITVFNEKERSVTEINYYQGDNIQFTINKIEIGSGNDMITYYLSDIYVTNVQNIKSAFASGTYSKNVTDSALNMAEENNALLAISGDYYGNSENSVVIRNGILYRSTGNDADVCVLFTDGTMKTYAPENFDADEVIQKGAWQAWTFGPALLDEEGNIPDSFHTTDYLYGSHPRSAIGYVEPGHFVFVAVDGRYPGYSRGANVNELALIMKDAGCVTAYNLDGGKSASMVYDGEYVNIPAQGGRDISDIIYLCE